EDPIEGTPMTYVTLYTDCWQTDPEKRPNIQEVSSLINYKILQQPGLFTNDKSYEFFKKIVEELCELIIEEKMQGKTTMMILDRVEKFFINKRQRPENLIDWCLNNQINPFYDYSEFSNIQLIGSGNFGKVYHAVMESSGLDVALKSFDNNNEVIVQGIIDELKLHNSISTHNNIIRFYGVSTEEGKNELQYILVFGYADSGTLRSYLQINFYKLNWMHKLTLTQQLVDAIKFMHEKDIIHENL
ncbi:2129_t:CDS:2, partial [Scutellospora calospora]